MRSYNSRHMYYLPDCISMGWGKVRRVLLIAFRKKRVVAKLDRRRGACTRCGACCKILFKCPAYDESDGNPKCLIYNDRPGVCSLFPLDEKDLGDRNIVMPGTKCGFHFEDGPRSDVERRESMPLRWGPSKNRATNSGKSRIVTGTLAIFWSFFLKPSERANRGYAKRR